MKAFIKNNFYLLGIVAFTSLKLPLVSVDAKTFMAFFGDNGGYPQIPDTLNIPQVVTHCMLFTKWENIALPQALILISLSTFCVMALTQLIVSILKNYKGMLYTAIVLFITALSLYFLLVLKSNTVVLYGYYIFLMLQILLIAFNYKTLAHTEITTR